MGNTNRSVSKEHIEQDTQSILEDNTIQSYAKYIKERKCKKIIVLTGAGISTSAGIPDFRSLETGMYSNLQKYNLPTPEHIFTLQYFLMKPQPFYSLTKEILPGNFKPTPCHQFLKVLADKGLLQRVYTQNIDMLERQTGLDCDLIVESHGSFHTATCVGKAVLVEQSIIKEMIQTSENKEYRVDKTLENTENPTTKTQELKSKWKYVRGCKRKFTFEEFKTRLQENKTIAECPDCGGYIKPDIIFFGEVLPSKFQEKIRKDFKKCDALIVIGTSLSVGPFNRLITFVDKNVPRLLINRERVGTYDELSGGFDFTMSVGKSRRDAVWEGDCDKGVEELCKLLGCYEDLESKIIDNNGLENKVELKLEDVLNISSDTLKPRNSVENSVANEIDQLSAMIQKVNLE